MDLDYRDHEDGGTKLLHQSVPIYRMIKLPITGDFKDLILRRLN